MIEKKIVILGRGNAGCISALHLRHELNEKVEIEMIYDSNIPPVPTGQGTALGFPENIYKTLQPKVDSSFPFTYKHGIMYEGWGRKQEKVFHDFGLCRYSIHFEPKEMQDYICNRLKEKINFTDRDENVLDYKDIDADYIIDCRGAPKQLDNNYKELVNPLNCALLSTLPYKADDVQWTRTIATPDGWCFYIPLPDKVSVGYLYNSNISTEEEATNNFKKYLGVEKVNKVFPFKQYISKTPIIDDRVLLNGNKLFFLEPLEATAMDTYQYMADRHLDFILGYKNKEEVIKEINKYILQVENFILWHYETGSKYNTKFWRYATDLAKNSRRVDFTGKLNHTLSLSKEEIKQKSLYTGEQGYAQWGDRSIKLWYDGVN